MYAKFFICFYISCFTSFSSEGEFKNMNVIIDANNEGALKKSFEKGFGVVRVLYSKNKEYIVFAKEKRSGVVSEDIYVYRKTNNKFILLSVLLNSSVSASTITVEKEMINILDEKGNTIISIKINNLD